LHDAASETMRPHVLEPPQPSLSQAFPLLPVDDTPAGTVLRTQQPLVMSDQAELARWPRFLEWAKPLGANSRCYLPLTTARRRLGALVLASRHTGAYDTTDLDFLQQVANQV